MTTLTKEPNLESTSPARYIDLRQVSNITNRIDPRVVKPAAKGSNSFLHRSRLSTLGRLLVTPYRLLAGTPVTEKERFYYAVAELRIDDDGYDGKQEISYYPDAENGGE